MRSLRVASVSLGSSRRDFSYSAVFAGRQLVIERTGTNGDLTTAASLIQRLDGAVDVICLGGINLGYRVGTDYYSCPEGVRLKSLVRRSMVVDGQAFKDTYEVAVARWLAYSGLKVSGAHVLVASVLDRWGLALGFEQQGARVLVGDAAFALGIPFLFPGLRLFSLAARLTMPGLSRIPIRYLYPLGKKQDERHPMFRFLFGRADFIAGDFHFIRRYMPEDLTGKVVVTTTTTEEDLRMLEQAGVLAVCTMAGGVNGRTPGANVWDGVAAAIAGAWPLSGDELTRIWGEIGLAPQINRFKTEAGG